MASVVISVVGVLVVVLVAAVIFQGVVGGVVKAMKAVGKSLNTVREGLAQEQQRGDDMLEAIVVGNRMFEDILEEQNKLRSKFKELELHAQKQEGALERDVSDFVQKDEEIQRLKRHVELLQTEASGVKLLLDNSMKVATRAEEKVADLICELRKARKLRKESTCSEEEQQDELGQLYAEVDKLREEKSEIGLKVSEYQDMITSLEEKAEEQRVRATTLELEMMKVRNKLLELRESFRRVGLENEFLKSELEEARAQTAKDSHPAEEGVDWRDEEDRDS